MTDFIDLLDQENVWMDREGVEHAIADMEPRYCRNVANYLIRRAPEIADHMARLMLRTPMPSGAVAFDQVDADMGREFARMSADPAAWVRDTPLVVALEARAAQGGAS